MPTRCMRTCGRVTLRPFDDTPVFAAPWEAEAFAMAVKLHERGVFSWTEWAETLGAAIKAHPERPYYENWLSALEQLAEAKKLMTHDERHERIDAWDRAARATPHGQPIVLGNS
jgi:nitrile hydratase accessory protein